MPHTILILEDEPTIRENLTAFLEDDGFEVLEAEDAKTALDLLSQHQPSLAVVDIRLPDSDGNQWMIDAAKIQADLQFIVYTGVLEYKPTEDVAKLGVTDSDVFYKPVESMDEISNLIRKKLSG